MRLTLSVQQIKNLLNGEIICNILDYNSLLKYFSKIKKGGNLIIEDVIDSNWVEPLVKLSYALGYSDCEIVDMTEKQKTNELLERWKNGLYILKITK